MKLTNKSPREAHDVEFFDINGLSPSGAAMSSWGQRHCIELTGGLGRNDLFGDVEFFLYRTSRGMHIAQIFLHVVIQPGPAICTQTLTCADIESQKLKILATRVLNLECSVRNKSIPRRLMLLIDNPMA